MCRRCPLKYEACTKINHFYSRWCNWYPDDKKDISCLLFLNVEDVSFFDAAYPRITTYKTDVVWWEPKFPYRRATAKHLFFAYGTDGQPPKNTLGESLGVSFIWKKARKQHRSLGKCPWNLIGDNWAIPYYRAWFWSLQTFLETNVMEMHGQVGQASTICRRPWGDLFIRLCY